MDDQNNINREMPIIIIIIIITSIFVLAVSNQIWSSLVIHGQIPSDAVTLGQTGLGTFSPPIP
jgi:hypothetical protein